MKIVAVIPARAGSKGVPNKNIRILNGKPLAYYAMKNAVSSKYITDVIVTTDSREVMAIAKQLPIAVHERSADLCDDKTTLDAVVYDAVKDIDCDYVITMQPTSPTLTVETLDKAIAHMLNNTEIETLMSALNSPHLAWTDKDGVKVPLYEKRLNRQYLPPYYAETGAFFISKRSVVKENTRFGKVVDVFEVPRKEALDIDNFSDLQQAEAILKAQKIAFYVNGNNSRGVGHIYRVLEIADELLTKPCIYYDENQTSRHLFGDTTHTIVPVNGINELFASVQKEQYDVFINDILTTSIDYMYGLRNCLPDARIINFEDDGEGGSIADVVINSLYDVALTPNMKVGHEYYISPKLFLMYNPIEIKEEVKTVFISFGGADPQNYTDRLMDIVVNEKYNSLKFVFVLGRAKKNVEELLKFNNRDNIEVYYDVQDMPEVMTRADIAVTSRGRTGYELAILGIPTISLAQNKRENQHNFIHESNGFSYLGVNPTDATIESTLDYFIAKDKSERQRISDMLTAVDLKGGRHKIRELIHE